eukprot:114230-Prorocentrum_minimum.AAC.2
METTSRSLLAFQSSTHRRFQIRDTCRTPVLKRWNHRHACVASTADQPESHKKRVVVIGAGWAGLGAAWALSKRPGVAVTLLDAAPQVSEAPSSIANHSNTPNICISN